MDESLNWRFGVAGNIVGKHTDSNGNVYYGTKAFTPGTKIYLEGKNWNNDSFIHVIGRNRFGRIVSDCVEVNLIENVRVQRIFKPCILERISYLDVMEGWSWWGRTSQDRNEVKEFVKDLNIRKTKNV